MRYVLCAAVLLGGLVLVPATGWAQKACPSDAAKASQALWPSGAISTGKTVTGQHPCGKRLQCSGGSNKGGDGGRSCRWL